MSAKKIDLESHINEADISPEHALDEHLIILKHELEKADNLDVTFGDLDYMIESMMLFRKLMLEHPNEFEIKTKNQDTKILFDKMLMLLNVSLYRIGKKYAHRHPILKKYGLKIKKRD